jgi:hypothetical protein
VAGRLIAQPRAAVADFDQHTIGLPHAPNTSTRNEHPSVTTDRLDGIADQRPKRLRYHLAIRHRFQSPSG